MTQPDTAVKPLSDKELSEFIRMLGHPLRIGILRVLEEGPGSPSDVALLLNKPIGNVSYHFRMLAKLNMVRVTKRIPRRGAVKHIYALTPFGEAALRFLRIYQPNGTGT